MNIKCIIDFIQNETPENEKFLLAAYHAVFQLIREEQTFIDSSIPKLIASRDYDKVTKYVEMSKMVSDICLEIVEKAKECGLGVNNVKKEDSIEKDEIVNELPEDEIDPFLATDKRINYEDYRVDENVEYGLMTDFCHMKPAAFSLEGIRYPARQWKLVLLQTCELLWKKDHNLFESFAGDKFMQGVRRHIVGGVNRTLNSELLPPRLCRIGTCRRLLAG